MAVVAGIHGHGFGHIPDSPGKGESGNVHLHFAVIELTEGQQVLDDTGHAVGLVDDDAEELLLQLRRQVSCGVGHGLGVGFDVGQRGTQLMGHIGHKFPAGLLALALLGDIVDDDDDTGRTALGGKGGHKQLQAPVPHGLLRLHKLRALQGQHLGQLGLLAEHFIKPAGFGRVTAQHLDGGGVGVDDAALGVKGHHAVGHVQKQGGEFVALVFGGGQGVSEHTGHVVEVPGQRADFIPGGNLQLFRKIPGGHPTGALGQRPQRGNENLGQQHRQDQTDAHAHNQGLDNNIHHVGRQVIDSGFVVQHIDDVRGVVPCDGHRQIHIGAGNGAVLAHLPIEGRQQVGGGGNGGSLVGSGKHGAAAVQDVDVAPGNVDAQSRLGHQPFLHLFGALIGGVLQLPDEFL